MRKRLKKATLLIFAICLLSSFSSVSAAVMRSSDYMQSYSAYLTSKGGQVSVYATVTGRNNYYPKIGTSTILIYESTNNGKTFSYYGIYESEDYPSMMGSGGRYSQVAISFPGTRGNQYKATVYCYAEDNTSSEEIAYYTSAITA
jgi:hypothetical protein